jgi:cobalt-zinc-cadmium resistance protein CzcA
LIPAPSGTQVPLSQLADVQIKDGPNQIQREDAKRRIVVGFNVRGRDVQSIVKELQEKTDKQIKLPTGYYVTYGGAFENLNAAKQRLLIAVPVSLLLILLLLFFAFNSLKQGLLIYSAIPLSATGGIFSLALRGMPFSISAGVGFIALFGVAVLNGIVLIAELNRLRQEGFQDLKEIVLKGTILRLRPVLMTAFVASLGFLPMAVSNGSGAEVQRPLATVVIGGLLLSTLLTLFVLPILYIAFEKVNIKKKKMKQGTVVCVILIMLSISFKTNAQQTISLQAAIDTALKNNLTIKNEKLKATYQQMLVATAKNIAPTNVIAEAGQINSFYTDTKLSITQQLALPIVYKRQKNLFEQEAKNSFLNVAVKESMLKKQVEQSFYQIVYLKNKLELLGYMDTLYSSFQKRAALRLKAGESNILEKATADNQLGQISVQLNQLQADIKIAEMQFQLLLNTNTELLPFASSYKMSFNEQIDSSMLVNHPVLKQILQQQQIAIAAIKVDESKLLPELIAGINNTSFRGIGADDKIYGGSSRFTSVQAGISIPIFRTSQKAKIEAAKFNNRVAKSNYDVEEQYLKNNYVTTLMHYQKYLQTVAHFENNALNTAQQITITANQQLANGAINYLEWVQLINQSVSTQNDYIEAVKNLNESIIQLHFFTNK